MSSWTNNPILYYIGAGVVGISVVVYVARKLLKIRAARKRNERIKNYPANIVILHQIPRAPWAPNMSPFPLKLETYLRMTKIPYQNVFGLEMSSKGKTPWMVYNGQEMADSQFCIDYLNKKLDKDCNSHLSKTERAIARAFQKMTEENLYWTILLQRWVYNDNWAFMKIAFKMPAFVLQYFAKYAKAQAHAQGIGRHSQEEVMTILKGDMAALSDFLGTKKFLMGNHPCEMDCAIFGMLAQMKWQMPGTPHEKFIKVDFPNLSAYCNRMKDEFWPDWDDCNTAGGTKKATK